MTAEPSTAPDSARHPAPGGWMAGLLGLAAVLAFWRLGAPSLNVDEVFTVYVARLGLHGLLRSMELDSHPPLLYLLAKAWLLVASSEAWLRTLPVLAHLGVVALLVRWAWREEGPATAVAAGLLAASSSWSIYRAQELRQYALLALFGWLSLDFLWRGRYGLYGLFAAVGLYTHYNAGLLLPVPWVWMLLARGSEPAPRARPLALAQAAVVLAFAPWIPMLLAQVSHGQGTSTLLTRSIYARSLLRYVVEIFQYLGVGAHTDLRPLVEWLVTLLFLGLLALGWRSMRNRSLATMLACAILVPIAVAVVVQLVTGRGLISGKHAHFVYLGVYFLAGAGVARLRGWCRPLSGGVLALLVACNLLSWHRATYDPEFQNPPWRQVVRDVEEQARPGDAILVFVPYQGMAFLHYKTGDHRLYRLDPPLDEPGKVPQILEGLAVNHPRVWLVLVNAAMDDPEQSLHAAFDHRFRRVWDRVYPNRAPFDRVWTSLYETRRASEPAAGSRPQVPP